MFTISSFLSLPGKAGKQESRISRLALDENMESIAGFLTGEDHQALKLTCQSFYYHFVALDIWTGMKLGIAEQKLQHYYDDFQFEETEAKTISKKDKNIRIHSLKKQKGQQNSRQNNNYRKNREASNIKEKGKMIKANNQLLFRNTEIGFKRLLKTNPRKKVGALGANVDIEYSESQISSLDFPKNFKLSDYLINSKDPWSLNIQRSQNLLGTVKKWNDYLHKIILGIKKPMKQFGQLADTLKNIEQRAKSYITKFNDEPYQTIMKQIEGANQNLLIDELLNKVCRLFWSYHHQILSITEELKPFQERIAADHKNIGVATGKFTGEGIQLVQMFGLLEEAADNFIQMNQKCPTLAKLICPNIVSIVSAAMESNESLKIHLEIENKLIVSEQGRHVTSLETIGWSDLVKSPNYFQILLQIMLSLCSKVQKMMSTCCDNELTLSILVNRIKNTKNITQNLWNIAKYFNKLCKQVEAKKKQAKKDKKMDAIRQFFESYENRTTQLYLIKNPNKIEKDVVEFKENIGELKEKMQKQ